jgi:hypothetical protein
LTDRSVGRLININIADDERLRTPAADFSTRRYRDGRFERTASYP